MTKDTKALAEKVTASGGTKNRTGGDVLFAGEVPGIGTKARNNRIHVGATATVRSQQLFPLFRIMRICPLDKSTLASQHIV